MERTRTGTTETLTESYVALSTLLFTDDTKGNFVDVLLENTGDTDLKITTGAATDANAKTLAAGESLFLANINLAKTFVKTTDDGGENALEFVGTPEA